MEGETVVCCEKFSEKVHLQTSGRVTLSGENGKTRLHLPRSPVFFTGWSFSPPHVVTGRTVCGTVYGLSSVG